MQNLKFPQLLFSLNITQKRIKTNENEIKKKQEEKIVATQLTALLYRLQKICHLLNSLYFYDYLRLFTMCGSVDTRVGQGTFITAETILYAECGLDNMLLI